MFKFDFHNGIKNTCDQYLKCQPGLLGMVINSVSYSCYPFVCILNANNMSVMHSICCLKKFLYIFLCFY